MLALSSTAAVILALFVLATAALAVAAFIGLNRFIKNRVGISDLSIGEWLYVAKAAAAAMFAQRFGKQPADSVVAVPRAGHDPISPHWLNSVLAKHGCLREGTQVTGVNVRGLDGNRGLRGVMLSIDVEYSDDAKGGKGAKQAAKKSDKSDGTEASALLNPHSLVFKTVLFQDAGHRYDMLIARNHREAHFYASSLERSLHLSGGVRVLHSLGDASTGDSAIISEDLRLERPGCLGVNFYCGNQVWGIPAAVKAAMANRSPVDLLRVMFRRAAEIHAPFWNDRATLLSPGFAWLKATAWYRGQDRHAWSVAIKASKGSWEVGKSKRKGGDALPPRLVAIMDASYAATSWEALQARLADRSIPVTLTHGDFHASNALWQPPAGAAASKPPATADGDDGKLFLVDWAEVGAWEPCTDLAQMMVSDIPPAVRRQHEDGLLSLYVDRLRSVPGSRVPADFTPARAKQLYARGGPERWIFFISILAAMPLPDAAIRFFADQFLAFVDDHEAHAPARGPGGVPAYPMGTLGTIGMVFGRGR